MKRVLIYLLLILLVLQLYPIDRSGNKETFPIQTSKEVQSILTRSCYNCHSNQTEWPIYSYVFPFSVILENHVQEGRDELNFSTWESLSLKKKATLAFSIMEQIEEGEMPIMCYTLIHKNARLTENDIKILGLWADKMEEEHQSEE